jgi:hypothetical protein
MTSTTTKPDSLQSAADMAGGSSAAIPFKPAFQRIAPTIRGRAVAPSREAMRAH